MNFDSKHVAAAAGISPATLRNWTVRGLVEPTFPAQGRGYPAEWIATDLMTVVALARLVDMGMTPADAVTLADKIGSDASEYLLLTRPGVYARPSAEERSWRLYWTWTSHGWSHSTEPHPTRPTITIDAAGMAIDAMQRLYDEYPETEERTTE